MERCNVPTFQRAPQRAPRTRERTQRARKAIRDPILRSQALAPAQILAPFLRR